METIKGVATIVAYSATGAIVGRVIDALSDRIFQTWDWDGPAIRAGAQLFVGVAALANVTQSLTGASALIDDTYGAIPAMWYFFFSNQKNLGKDIDSIVDMITSGFQRALAPRVSEESIIHEGQGGVAINERQAERTARTQDLLGQPSE